MVTEEAPAATPLTPRCRVSFLINSLFVKKTFLCHTHTHTHLPTFSHLLRKGGGGLFFDKQRMNVGR